ncbi:hypothetical protein E2562_028389 [Oryza meyeriana var. granulata]|uniref:Uncharacterized protein n=1 Tax=Oryza meyeriana var. granulata TaxID=110450 RepID=A0A6G1E585_9ORYZ|nr:hypothetical protein E2562_028389 [Oryza meyeriana var. granulata]
MADINPVSQICIRIRESSLKRETKRGGRGASQEKRTYLITDATFSLRRRARSICRLCHHLCHFLGRDLAAPEPPRRQQG